MEIDNRLFNIKYIVLEVMEKGGVPFWVLEDDQIVCAIKIMSECYTTNTDFYCALRRFFLDISPTRKEIANRVTMKRMIELTKTNFEFKKRFGEAQKIAEGSANL